MPISLFGGGPQVTVALDRPEGPYYPGDVVHVTVTVDSEKENKISGLRVGLQGWEGGFTRSDDGSVSSYTLATHEVASETLMGETRLPAAFHQTYRVALPIPSDAFPPYSSSTLTCTWAVQASAGQPLKKDATCEVDVPLVVPPPGERVQAGEFGESSDAATVDLRLWLPRLEWVEGETIAGRLLIHPRKVFDAHEVRVSLRRVDMIHAPRHKMTGTYPPIVKAVLAGKTHFEPGQGHDMPFSLPLPAKGQPTVGTEWCTVSYTLKGVLGRRLRKDFVTETEIWLYNGRR